MQDGVTRAAIGRAHLEDVARGREARGRGTCHTWRAQTTASSWTFTNRPDWSCARRQQRTHARTAKMQGAQRPVVLGEGVKMHTCRAASANEASHSIAFAVEHATDGPPVVWRCRDRAEIARRSRADRAQIARRSRLARWPRCRCRSCCWGSASGRWCGSSTPPCPSGC